MWNSSNNNKNYLCNGKLNTSITSYYYNDSQQTALDVGFDSEQVSANNSQCFPSSPSLLSENSVDLVDDSNIERNTFPEMYSPGIDDLIDASSDKEEYSKETKNNNLMGSFENNDEYIDEENIDDELYSEEYYPVQYSSINSNSLNSGWYSTTQLQSIDFAEDEFCNAPGTQLFSQVLDQFQTNVKEKNQPLGENSNQNFDFEDDIFEEEAMALMDSIESNDFEQEEQHKQQKQESETLNQDKKFDESNQLSDINPADLEIGPLTQAELCKQNVNNSNNNINFSQRTEQISNIDPPLESKNSKIIKGSISSNEKNLSYWGLPNSIVEAYRDLGIHSLYHWQVACLQQYQVTLKGENLIYSAPTSGGKTLVAEILMIRRLFQNRKKCIFILPFVSLVEEKVEAMDTLFSTEGITVGGHFATKGGSFGEEEDIAVCTIEKANSVINRMVEEGTIDELSTVVVDEVHMIGDKDRGYLLELLLTKLRFMDSGNIQIIGMSATLPNVATLADWLDAYLFVTDFRPVPLEEYVKFGSVIHNKSLQPIRNLLSSGKKPVASDPDMVSILCEEVTQNGNSVLIFCSTKYACERCAKMVSRLRDCENIEKNLITERYGLIEELRRTFVGLDPTLEKTIPQGVAYHHAGLTLEERRLVERGYRQGILDILTCTTTLSAGVNLPARRVIFRSTKIARSTLDVIRYRQASGRAGRAGKDNYGESILIADIKDKFKVQELVNSSLPSLCSCLTEEKRGMTRALLEVISGGVVETVYDIERFIRCTLLSAQVPYKDVHHTTKVALKFLEENEFLSWKIMDCKFVATKLGKATFSSSLSPEEGLVVFEELSRARKNMVLDSELHMVYQVTPVFHGIYPNWNLFQDLLSRLPSSLQECASAIGVFEPFVIQASNARPKPGKETDIHKRFYAALMLYELIQETPLNDVSSKFNIPRGSLQSLQNLAATFSGMVTTFCRELKWWPLEVLLHRLKDRLNYGAQMDILPLLQIPHVKAHRARALYNEGYKSIESIAHAEIQEIERILQKIVPFQSRHNRNNHDFQIDSTTARKIINNAKRLLVRSTSALSTPISTESSYKAEKSPEKFTLKVTRNNKNPSTPLSSSPDSTTHERSSQFKSPKPVYPNTARKLFSDPNTKSTKKSSSMKQTQTGIKRSASPQFSTTSPPVKKTKFESTKFLQKKKSNFPISNSPSLVKKNWSSKESSNENQLPKENQENLPQNWEEAKIIIDKINWENTRTKMPFKYRKIQNEIQLWALYYILIEKTTVSWHLSYSETKDQRIDMDQKRSNFRIRGIAFCWDSEHAYYIGTDERILNDSEIFSRIKFIKKFCHNNQLKKIAYDSKLFIKILLEYNAQVLGQVMDPKIADWVINPEEKKDTSLGKLLDDHLKSHSINGTPTNELERSCKSAIQSWILMNKLEEVLSYNLLLSPFLKVEMPFTSILAEMEYYGMGFDPDLCTSYRQNIMKAINVLEQQAHDLVGKEFSLASPPEIAEVLYDDLKLPEIKRPKKTKRRIRNRVTSADVLEKLRKHHPLPGVILEYRKLKTLLTKYINLPSFAVRDPHTDMQRIFATMIQTHSATGRLAVHNPNLQSIPHPISFPHPDAMPENENEDVPNICVNMRKTFIAKKGCLLLSVDYCQIEVRLMAHFSQDPILQRIFAQNSGDIFKQVASKLIEKPEEQISRDEREKAKRVCYGIIYGMGARSLASELKIDVEEAASYIEAFKCKYQGVSRFMGQAPAGCKENGFVETVLKRRRYLPMIYSSSPHERSQAERQAINTICQGSAADLIKRAMVEIVQILRTKPEYQNIESRLILQIHDELLFEVEEDHIINIATLVKQCMENAVSLSVPTPVRCKYGKNWGSLEDLDVV